MSPAPQPPRRRRVSRAGAFAASVRRRADRFTRSRLRLRASAAVSGMPAPDSVLRLPRRPVTHRHWHLTMPGHTVVNLAVGLRRASVTHPVQVRTVWQTTSPAGGPPTAAPAGAVAAQVLLAAPTPVTLVRPPVAAPATRVTAAGLPVPASQHPSAADLRRTAAAPVPMVHRRPAAAAASLPGATGLLAEARRPPALGVRWGGRSGAAGPPGELAATPLTTSDVPAVVDRVVREIDRRLVAARERRGWTA